MNKSLTKSILKQVGIASLAASMFALVGCDGDTGPAGPAGADGIRNLSNEELTNEIFGAAVLRFTFDPTTVAGFDGTPEIIIDFASDQVGVMRWDDLNLGILNNQHPAFNNTFADAQVLIVGLDAPGDGTFTIEQVLGDRNGNGIVNHLEPIIEDATFTVSQVVQNTYLGRVTLGFAPEPVSVTLSQEASAVVPNAINLPGTLPAPFGDWVLADVQQQLGAGRIVQVQTDTDARDTVYNLEADEVAIRFENPSLDEADIVFVVKSPIGLRAAAATVIDFAGIVFDPANEAIGSPSLDIPAGNDAVRILSGTLEVVPVTGTFRLDIDSTAGGDASFLPAN